MLREKRRKREADFVRKISSRERLFARLNILRRAMASGIVNEVLCTKYHVQGITQGKIKVGNRVWAP